MHTGSYASLVATAQRSSKWAWCFLTALDLLSSCDLHPQKFCLSLRPWTVIAYVTLSFPCMQNCLPRDLHHCLLTVFLCS